LCAVELNLVHGDKEYKIQMNHNMIHPKKDSGKNEWLGGLNPRRNHLGGNGK
jgi:hypothetical protein